MKLALEHPAWSLLYGPYGVQDVSGALAQLAKQWDQPLADTLYWEMLHHQEDLYPVTYAALPWLWEIAPKDLTNLSFLSWILHCAAYPNDLRDLATPRSLIPGLSSLRSDTSEVFQRERTALVEQHPTVLLGIEQWCNSHFPTIAERCQAALPDCQNPHDIYNLLVGPMTVEGAQKAANVLGMWCDGHDPETIAEETETWSEKDLQLSQKWVRLLDQHAPECGAALRDYAQLEGGNQITLRCNDTPDLFRKE